MEMTNDSTIGSILRWYRNEQGKTISQVAEELETSPSAVSLYENDKRKPNANTLERLVTTLNIQPSDKERLFDLRNTDEESESVPLTNLKENNNSQSREMMRRKPQFIDKRFKPDFEIDLIEGITTYIEIKSARNKKDVDMARDEFINNARLIEKAIVKFLGENKIEIYRNLAYLFDEELQRLHDRKLALLNEVNEVQSEIEKEKGDSVE